MYTPKYVRYLNFPQLPDYILQKINFNFDQYESKSPGRNYVWTDSFNQEIDEWCKQNICEDMYWAFQIITGELPMHQDKGTKVKMIYLLDTGGPDVYTEFYSDDQTTLLQSVKLELHRWHIMKVDVFHRVTGVESGKTRFSITGRIFE